MNKTRAFLGIALMSVGLAVHSEVPPSPAGSTLTAIQSFKMDVKTHILFTEFSVPYRGSMDWITGRTNADPSMYKIAVYSFTSDSWYSKPYYNQPDVYIAQDGSFTFTVATGLIKPESQSNVRAFVVPLDFQIPISEGSESIPAEVIDASVFTIQFNR